MEFATRGDADSVDLEAQQSCRASVENLSFSTSTPLFQHQLAGPSYARFKAFRLAFAAVPTLERLLNCPQILALCCIRPPRRRARNARSHPHSDTANAWLAQRQSLLLFMRCIDDGMQNESAQIRNEVQVHVMGMHIFHQDHIVSLNETPKLICCSLKQSSMKGRCMRSTQRR